MKERALCKTVDLAGPVGVLHARYFGRAFAPHWHEEYAIGLIDVGIEEFDYRGVRHRAGQGEVVLMNAGEVHTGDSWDERGFGFRMLYVPLSTLLEVRGEGRTTQETPSFKAVVLDDATAGQALFAAHRSIEHDASGLEIESLLLMALAEVASRSLAWLPAPRSRGVPQNLRLAYEYLLDHVFEEVSLEDLTRVSGLSKFHLLRAFRSRFGLPPHSFQLQQRIFKAKELLRTTAPLTVAMICGFADQSHFHRVFRAHVGTTPGQYSQQFHSRRFV